MPLSRSLMKSTFSKNGNGVSSRTLRKRQLWANKAVLTPRAWVVTIDYRCEHSPFPVSASCVTISNPDSLSSSGSEVYFEIKGWKIGRALIWMSLMSKSRWWYLFHEEVKSRDSTAWFRIWQFQTSALKVVSSNASPGWTVRFFFSAMIEIFWIWDSSTIQWRQYRLLTHPLLSVSTSIVHGCDTVFNYNSYKHHTNAHFRKRCSVQSTSTSAGRRSPASAALAPAAGRL